MADKSSNGSFYNGYNDHSSSSNPGATGTGSGAQSATGHRLSFQDQQQSSAAGLPVSSNKSNKVPGAEGGLTSSVCDASLVGQHDVRKSKADPVPQGYSGAPAHGERRYDTKFGINVRIYSGDISKSEADAITTSEGCQVDLRSQVTRSISYLPGIHFEEKREKLFRLNGGRLQEGIVYDTNTMNDPVKYQYVLHAVIDSTTNDNMSKLYYRVFKRSDELNMNTVAVPLLGTGRGHIKVENAVRDLARGLLDYAVRRPYTKHLNVAIVTQDVKLIDIIYNEIEKRFNSLTESASTLQSGTSMSKTTSKKQPQSSAQDTSELGNKALGADAHHRSDQSNAHKTGPQRRSHRSTTIKNGVMVAVSESEKASAGALLASDDETKMASLEARTASLFLGHHGATDAGNTPPLGGRGQYNQFDQRSSPAEVEDDLDETNRVSHEKQPEPEGTDIGSSEEEICPICMDVIQNLKVLDKCGHKFCKECIEDSFRSYKPVCPSCLTVYAVVTGNMPHGTMSVRNVAYPSLPGYEGSGIITIEYHFPNGIQTKDHPHPGQIYHGTSRVAFLPKNKEGEKVYRLLKLAFDRKLTFTVGRSATTGRDDVVTWNDIHHKTSIDGGPTRFGYPDATYLSRVQEELASKGITEDQL